MPRLPMFFQGLPPELLRKAEEELNETPQVREKALKEFKELIRKQQDIFCNMEDKFLLRFLRVKKFNVQKSLKVLRNYISLIQKYSGVFTNKLPSELKKFVDLNLKCCHPYRLDDSSHFITFRVGLFDPNDCVVEDLIAYLWAWGNIALEYEASQIAGFHAIVDLTDTNFSHYRTLFKLETLKFLICTLQDSFPVRVRGIHIVNEPYLAYSIFKVVKYFATKKLTEKIHFYGNDLSKLHQNIPKDILPLWLGGTTNEIGPEECASIFYSYEYLFERMKNYKIIENKT